MFQAITTRYLPPTNNKGARIAAFAEAGRITLSWNHEVNAERNHCAAARAFAEKFGWQGRYVGGSVRGCDYVWCGMQASGPVDGVDEFTIPAEG